MGRAYCNTTQNITSMVSVVLPLSYRLHFTNCSLLYLRVDLASAVNHHDLHVRFRFI